MGDVPARQTTLSGTHVSRRPPMCIRLPGLQFTLSELACYYWCMDLESTAIQNSIHRLGRRISLLRLGPAPYADTSFGRAVPLLIQTAVKTLDNCSTRVWRMTCIRLRIQPALAMNQGRMRQNKTSFLFLMAWLHVAARICPSQQPPGTFTVAWHLAQA